MTYVRMFIEHNCESESLIPNIQVETGNHVGEVVPCDLEKRFSAIIVSMTEVLLQQMAIRFGQTAKIRSNIESAEKVLCDNAIELRFLS